jgi:cytochrome P450
MVSYHQYCIMNDPKYWDDPQEFRPERFLEDGKYVTSKHLIPFGTGRRMCLGKNLAINDVFLIVVRLLQTTSDYEIALDGGPGSADLNVDNTLPDTARPNPYKIVLKSKT